MAITPRLEMRQGQSLVMTPQLQQAIKLLQFSNLELRDYLEEELATNPMLDRDESDGALPEERAPVEERTSESSEAQDASDALDMDDYSNVWDDEPAAAPASAQGSEAFADWGSGGDSRFLSDGMGLEETVSQGVSLRDHLLNQIQVDFSDPAERLIAVYLTDQIDESGRIPDELASFAEQLGCPLDKMEGVPSASSRAAYRNAGRSSFAKRTGSTRRWRRCSTMSSS